jgi:hypothetical protein
VATAHCGEPAAAAQRLPELARVGWRTEVSEETLRRDVRRWAACTLAHTIPLVATAALLGLLSVITLPLGLILLAQAWVVPELYAARGAGVLRRRPAKVVDAGAEHVAAGLLGDLVGHRSRELFLATGRIVEAGCFGAWVLGESGAVLVRPGGRRVHCYCVRVGGEELPLGDRVAHLLLALRSDEAGFATVANRAFVGGKWRLRRRLDPGARPALDYAVAIARQRKCSPAAGAPAGPGLTLG